jgi:hypothetical protein
VKRSTPLKRTARVKPKRATTRRSSREHDREYMQRVRGLACIVRHMLPDSADGWTCDGWEMHAHHAGERGLGQKCSDYETVPLCMVHHRDYHDCTGPFAGWSREKRREFAQAAIEDTQAKLGRLK